MARLQAYSIWAVSYTHLYCYEDGNFRKPSETMEEMIETCVPFMKENGMEEKEAREILNNCLPHLKRWKK